MLLFVLVSAQLVCEAGSGVSPVKTPAFPQLQDVQHLHFLWGYGLGRIKRLVWTQAAANVQLGSEPMTWKALFS